ncbi:MAG TPA: bifunctional SulP family inorganic anion transporter/carbonic anhydrase [Gammaproteobacteria bacterium]|jgi:carbonic anhydrase|nr:bifunctional SulP family inorganic anion transporter/carbonic anhydrase [Gammaproteobacteria bacterium]
MKEMRSYLNLGLPYLVQEWKKMFTTKYLASDLFAGVSVAFVAIPLSLAIALASGVTPEVGLITAIVAGIVCALFGGTPLSVCGPAAAMAVLIASNIEEFGSDVLIFLCFTAGCMQLLSGMLGFGKIARYVPLPVIAGFTAGIGVIIFIGQLPRVFGLAPPPESHIFAVVAHITQYIHHTNITCLALVAITLGIIKGLPKVLPKLPAILVAVIVSTAITYFFHLQVPLIGSMPQSLPKPHVPGWPSIPFSELILNAFTLYVLASLQTLLSSSAVDKMTKGKKHHPNQELIGQGLGNIAVSLFGGIPVSGLIARSSINVQAGAKTRRASIFHALIILLAVLAVSPFISMIPIAALAAVLVSISLAMVDYQEFFKLWRTSRSEAFIYAVTFFTIIFVDLIAGVQVGLVAAAAIILIKASKTHLYISTTREDDTIRLSLTGTLSFLSSGKIATLNKTVDELRPDQTIILDISTLLDIDTSGASAIVDLSTYCQNRQIHFYLIGLQKKFEPLFHLCDGEKLLAQYSLISEQELRKKETHQNIKSSKGRLVHGVKRFHEERKLSDRRLFDYIARRQDPHTLFITCSDSRIVSPHMTSSDPGELFIIRNIGNHIPTYQPGSQYSESAAIDFALSNFDITDIVVCGHAHCGAINACKKETGELSPNVKPWITQIRAGLPIHPDSSINELSKLNVLNQLENLKGYPIIQHKLAEGEITLHGWFIDFDKHDIIEWDAEKREFYSLLNLELVG